MCTADLESCQSRARYFLNSIKTPPTWAAVLNVVGEAGEFAEAYRRHCGIARRPGSIEEVSKELADVIISATCAAELLGLDAATIVENKWEEIFKRGFGNQEKFSLNDS